MEHATSAAAAVSKLRQQQLQVHDESLDAQAFAREAMRKACAAADQLKALKAHADQLQTDGDSAAASHVLQEADAFRDAVCATSSD